MDIMALEQGHLDETLAVIVSEKEKLEAETGAKADEHRVITVEGGDPDEVVRLNHLRFCLDTMHRLYLSQRQAYFAHLDYNDSMDGAQSVYIGRWGVMKTPENEIVVADWRAPIANLYYSGQVGRVDYETPEGRLSAELTLKRLLSVSGGKLLSAQDAGIMTNDVFLINALSQTSGDRLKDIVTTIQAEQNIVIRHPMKPLIVQGVAGSGKTTIALHRIAYLLYANQKTLLPSQMMILAPNPLFLDYISSVLPDLGVDEVKQTTFVLLCKKVMGKRFPKLRASVSLDARTRMTAEKRNELERRLEIKGRSSAYEAALSFLKGYEREILPEKDLTFLGTTVLTKAEMAEYYLGDLRNFPLYDRTREMRKYIVTRLSRLSDKYEEAAEKDMRARLDRLMTRLPDGEERRQKARSLFSAQESRIAELRKQAEAYPDAAMLEFGHLTGEELLARVYGSLPEAEILAQDIEELKNGRADECDLPLLMTIHRALYSVRKPDIRHIVVDEAQDLSGNAYRALRDYAAHQSFTLVGDLMQGVHAAEGLTDWREISDGVLPEAAMSYLETSYRSTVEIMTVAARAAMRHPVSGQQRIRPVLRHGKPVTYLHAESAADRLRIIAEAAESAAQGGMHSIAIIERSSKEAGALHKAIGARLQAKLITEKDTEYSAGVMIIPATLVKGLEFDSVIIAEAGAEMWDDTSAVARLLYVALTRALHEETIVYSGVLSALISDETEAEN